MAPAMRAGLTEIKRRRSPQRVNRLVLVLSGQTEREHACLKEADNAAHDDVPIMALGVGVNWNEDLLDEIADRSGGQVHFIPQADGIDEGFQSILHSMRAAVVQNAVLTLHLMAGVNPRKVWRVMPFISDLGYSPILSQTLTIPLGELEKAQGQALLVELMLPAQQAGTYRIAQADVVYDVPHLNLVQAKVQAHIMLNFTHDLNLSQQVNSKVVNIVEKVAAYEAWSLL